jgi:large subunit ribosomal protein L9
VLSVKTGEDGKLFGTVTTGMIADQLKTQFDVALDKRKIHLETPIRTLGEHEVELRLYQDVNTKLKVRVESSNPPPVVADAPAEGKREEPRTEKRGRRPETGVAEKSDKTEKSDAKARGGRAENSRAEKSTK